MDIFYTLNIIDFAERLALVSMLFLNFFKIRKMDNEIIKSITYLKFNDIRMALNWVMVSAPLFLIVSILEYPGFVDFYGIELVHLVQDIFLIFFQIGVIYFLFVVYRALNLPRK